MAKDWVIAPIVGTASAEQRCHHFAVAVNRGISARPVFFTGVVDDTLVRFDGSVVFLMSYGRIPHQSPFWIKALSRP
jgi:hypothetical protein